jgi:hypothetical protein
MSDNYSEDFKNAKARMARQGLGISANDGSVFNEQNEKVASSNDPGSSYFEQAAGRMKGGTALGIDATNSASLAHGGEANQSSNDSGDKYFEEAKGRLGT